MILSPYIKIIFIMVFINFFISLGLTLLFCILFDLLKVKPYTLEMLKIKKKLFNLSIVCLYLFFFVICLFIYRFYNINNYLNLNMLKQKVILYYKNTFILDSFFTSYNIIIIILILILLYSKLNSFCIKECLKLYVILFYKYETSFKYIEDIYNIFNLKKKLYVLYIKHITFKHNLFYDIINFIFIKLPLYLLIILILYDMFFNNMILHKTYHFLPLYLLHYIWLKISFFLDNTNKYITKMIYNIYYNGKSFVYVNMGSRKENIINIYIKNNLQIKDLLIEDSFILDVELHYLYTSTDGIYYKNIQGDWFKEEIASQRVDIDTDFTPLMLLLLYFFYVLLCLIFYYSICVLFYKLLLFKI